MISARGPVLVFVFVAVLGAACGIDARGLRSDDVGGAPETASSSAGTSDGGSSGDDGADGARPPPATPLCTQEDSALVACFGFDGSVTDDSPVRLAPLVAANLTFAPGREGQAVRLSLAPKSDLRLPYAKMNTAQMSIETWINPASLPPAGGRAILVDQNGRFGVILLPDGTIQCRSVSAATKAAAGVWHHIACVHDGAQLSAYVDGRLEAAQPNTLGSTSDFVGIGQDSPSGGDGFDGLFDNLRIWTRALSASEVLAAASR